MDLTMSITYGALGGLVVEAVVLHGRIEAWRVARLRIREGNKRRKLPRLDRYVDPQADTLAAISRLLLGAVAGWLLAAQVTGGLAAVTVGATAPALLRQVGSARTVHAVLVGAHVSSDPAEAGAEQPGASPGESEVIES